MNKVFISLHSFYPRCVFRFCSAVLVIVFLAVLFIPSISASDFVYKPVNPSFGGDAFNSAHLLRLAELQNRHEDKINSTRPTLSPADQFVRNLERRLLSSLAVQVNEAIFGEDAAESGTIEFGDQTISFERGLEAIHLTIEDAAAGTQTNISIPILQVE